MHGVDSDEDWWFLRVERFLMQKRGVQRGCSSIAWLDDCFACVSFSTKHMLQTMSSRPYPWVCRHAQTLHMSPIAPPFKEQERLSHTNDLIQTLSLSLRSCLEDLLLLPSQVAVSTARRFQNLVYTLQSALSSLQIQLLSWYWCNCYYRSLDRVEHLNDVTKALGSFHSHSRIAYYMYSIYIYIYI